MKKETKMLIVYRNANDGLSGPAGHLWKLWHNIIIDRTWRSSMGPDGDHHHKHEHVTEQILCGAMDRLMSHTPKFTCRCDTYYKGAVQW
jgi:hypothetical protein